MKLQLSIGMASNPRTWPLLDGGVKAGGIDLIPSVAFPSELFWRQLLRPISLAIIAAVLLCLLWPKRALVLRYWRPR